MAWLVAGLGNPGERYATTRHNAGRMVIDELARRGGAKFRKARFLPAEVAEVRVGEEAVWLVASALFMNGSGTSFAGIARRHRVEPAHLIAVHDEIEIPAGELRCKLGGGSAGHNGLRSLTQALRTPDYLRVRVGVGRPPGRQDPADFVLAPVGRPVQADLAAWVDRAADAVHTASAEPWLASGSPSATGRRAPRRRTGPLPGAGGEQQGGERGPGVQQVPPTPSLQHVSHPITSFVWSPESSGGGGCRPIGRRSMIQAPRYPGRGRTDG